MNDVTIDALCDPDTSAVRQILMADLKKRPMAQGQDEHGQ